MPKNVILTDANDLAAVALPNHGSSYTVVPHKFIIDETLAQLQANNFAITKEEYCRNINGEVAMGVYHLQYGNDPELGLMFTWANSYDKSMRFRCAVGAHVHVSEARMIAGDMSNYGRVHTGDAKDQVKEHIKVQIQGAQNYFSVLIQDKEKMKKVTLSTNQIGSLMGKLYFTQNTISSSQLINIKEEFRKPSFVYSTAADNLWTIYNHIIVGLKKAHPKSWMEQQKQLHAEVSASYLQSVTLADPNQTDLLEQIDEVESATSEVKVEEPIVNNSDEAPKTEEPALLSLEDYTENVIGEELEVAVPAEASAEEVLEATSTPVVEEESLPEDLNESDASETEYVTEEHPVAEEREESTEDPEVTEFLNDELTDPEHPEQVLQDIVMDNVEKAMDEAHAEAFPTPPADLPVSGEVVDEVPCETAEKLEQEKATPLEEQVAGSEPAPVTEEEKAVSAAPIVDEPITEAELNEQLHGVNNDEEAITMTVEPEEEEEEDEDLAFLKEGPTEDPVFAPEDNTSSNDSLLEEPDFEF